MKNLAVSVLAVFVVLPAAFAQQADEFHPLPPLNQKVEKQARVARMQRPVAGEYRVLEQASGLEHEVMALWDQVKTVKQDISAHFAFPQNVHDADAIGRIFQALSGIMDSYNDLRAKNVGVAQRMGAYLAGEHFITTDNHDFTIISFIQMFVAQLPSQPLQAELMTFKDNLRNDAAAVDPKIQAYQNTPEFKAVKRHLDSFREIIAKQERENKSHVLQSLLYLFETLAENYAQDPREAERGGDFVAKDPKALQVIVEEIKQPVKVGFSEKPIEIANYLRDNMYVAQNQWMSPEPAAELDVFLRVLAH